MDANIEAETERLKTALKDKKKDDVIEIICSKNSATRVKMAEYYKTAYGKDFTTDIKKALGGHFEDVCVALFTPPIDYDCQCLRAAMKGLGTDEDTLIEIIATRPGWMIKQIVTRYKELLKRDLVKDVESETSGSFRKLLVSLLQGNRSDNTAPNDAQCQAWAKELYDAGEKKWGTDESIFNKTFAIRSPQELGQIARYYHQLTGHTILQAIDKEFSGDTKKLLTAIVYAVLSPSEYFATRIQKSVKGLGTKDKMLIRVMVTRSEMDMPQIKQYYKQLYGKDMVADIKGDTSGDYQKILVKLAERF